MHAWEAIQKTLNYIEDNIGEDLLIEELADIAALSLFYYQRLFARLVKKPVYEYIKLRRLARAREMLLDKDNRIIDVAFRYGFGGRETFTRAFKSTYGLTPAEYRNNPIGLSDFDRPDLSLYYIMVDEGVPLISEGLVFEYNRRFLTEPVFFLGVSDIWRFKPGKMLGERPGIDEPGAIWNRFYSVRKSIPSLPKGRVLGVTYHGGAPDGYSSYFVGAEVEAGTVNPQFTSFTLPPREYIVCSFEAENGEMLVASLGKMMKFTRLWLRNHGLRVVDFFPEIYYHDSVRVDK